MSAVFISQLVPGLRGLISIPAGFAHMNIFLFTLSNFAGTLIWCAFLAFLGHELGRHFGRINQMFGPVEWVIGAVLVLGAVTWLYMRKKRKGKFAR
jgi:membrane protein DedA with SNARE-associated domain